MKNIFILDFLTSQSPLEFRDIFKTESICIDDDEELNTINPDDFLNESFFKTETEVCHDRRIKTKSESSSGNSSENASMQLTPPISPQPLPVSNNLGVHLIPIATLHTQPKFHQIVQLQRQHERPILPAKTKSMASGSSDSDSNVINDHSKAASPVDKQLIKQARLIRNRESALQSRRKKKEYVQNLEVEIGSLRQEIYQLKEENSVLKTKLKSYGNFTCRCASSISNKLSTAKNTSLMLALILMIGFNFIPIGSFFSVTKNIHRSMAQRPDGSFNSRHLLYAENSSTSDERNSSEIPQFFNQTDRIRQANIENVLRWIPQPDLFNASRNFYRDYDFKEDPLQDKLAKMFEKSRDQMMQKKQAKPKVKRNNTQKKKSNHAQKIQENLYNPNFFKLHEFFDEINRKEDTFYVFSFRGEHLLLPALDYPQNFSQIVKMNLIMPRNNGEQALHFWKYF